MGGGWPALEYTSAPVSSVLGCLLPLPTFLGGVTLAVTDSAGVQRNAPLLYVSPSQINFLMPDNVASGMATFAVGGGTVAQSFTATVQPVAPTLFSMSGTGSGVAAALAGWTVLSLALLDTAPAAWRATR